MINIKDFEKNEFSLILKEIDVLQSQIRSCDRYSLRIKGWAITIWTALIYLTLNSLFLNYLISSIYISLLPSLILVVFWIMDGIIKHFQRVVAVRSTSIQDFINDHKPKECQKKNKKNKNKENQYYKEFMNNFAYYDPVGRISKENQLLAI